MTTISLMSAKIELAVAAHLYRECRDTGGTAQPEGSRQGSSVN